MKAVSRVLVVDDDIAVRYRVVDLLALTGGFEVHEAADGESGWRLAKKLRPDLILLDLMMPDMTGYEVCLALRAAPETREIPIIMLSAAEESEAMVGALEAGADDFLRKPFRSLELRAKVQTITRLNRYRALAAERDRFRWLLDHSLEPMLVVDARGRLQYANRPAREVFALAEEPRVDVVAAISRNFRAEPAEAWENWRERSGQPGAAFVVYRPEGEQVAARWFEVELQALDATSDQTLFKFTDRSGTVRHELETFSFQHMISHKIRTPLNGLAPILAFIAESEHLTLNAADADLLRLARESAERLEETLTGILRFHRAAFSGARLPPSETWTSWTQLLVDAAREAELEIRIAATDVTVARGEILAIALTEVLENYAKFSEARTRGVEVQAAYGAGMWEVSLFAPGPPLPPDVLARLGRPYAQLESKFTGEVPGLGLGLAMVRLLLRSIGGDIGFASRAGDSGLVTTFQIPARLVQATLPHAV